ncbi:hypothetical protein C7S15_5225 [Burkholderia cepacia]|nr:hypothetical protein [Burkholderia cepacia]
MNSRSAVFPAVPIRLTFQTAVRSVGRAAHAEGFMRPVAVR